MKRQPRLTKRERKAIAPPRPAPTHDHHGHLHCVACGVHLELEQLDGPAPSVSLLTCDHGGQFLACAPCVPAAQALIDEHEQNGTPVRAAAAWH